MDGFRALGAGRRRTRARDHLIQRLDPRCGRDRGRRAGDPPGVRAIDVRAREWSRRARPVCRVRAAAGPRHRVLADGDRIGL